MTSSRPPAYAFRCPARSDKITFNLGRDLDSFLAGVMIPREERCKSYQLFPQPTKSSEWHNSGRLRSLAIWPHKDCLQDRSQSSLGPVRELAQRLHDSSHKKERKLLCRTSMAVLWPCIAFHNRGSVLIIGLCNSQSPIRRRQNHPSRRNRHRYTGRHARCEIYR
jgi:hypothetical protein